MRSAKFAHLLVLLLASVSVGIGVICGGCNYSNFKLDETSPAIYQDSLRLSVSLQDTIFSRSSVNIAIHLESIVYPMLHQTALLDSLNSLKRPRAQVSITNLSHRKLFVPAAHPSFTFRPGNASNLDPLEYRIIWSGDTGTSSVIRLRIESGIHADRARFGPVVSDFWQKVPSGQTQVLCESRDLFEVELEDRDLPPGEYKVVFFLSNRWRKHAGDNYWTGAIQSDTVRFYLRDTVELKQ